MRRFNTGLLIVIVTTLFTLAYGTTACALSAEIVVDSNTLAVGESMTLNVAVNGSASANPPQFKAMNGLQINYHGPTTSVQIINGKMSASKIFNYSVVAIKAGNYTLGPLTVKSGRDTITTNRVQITVAAASNSQSLPGRNQTAGNSASGSLKDRLFLKADLPRKTYYAGETVQTMIRLYANNLSVRDVTYPTLKSADFCQINIGKPNETEENVNGIPYKMLEFPTTISFVKTGKFTLGPATLQCNVLVEQHNSDSFFDDFFSNLEASPQTLVSKPLPVEVLPLPAPPTGFCGGIGEFSLEANTGPQEVLEGDPVTVRLKVTGTGNLASIGAPVLTARDGLKVYDAQRKKSTTDNNPGEALFEQILFPLNTRVTQVGPYRLTFFNPVQRAYQTVTTQPQPVKVKPNPNFNRAALENTPDASEREQLGQGLVYLKESPGQLQKQGTEIQRQPWFWLLQLLPVGAVISAFGYRKRQDFYSSDSPLSRAFRADGKVGAQLAQAQKMLNDSSNDAFLDELHRIFREYLADKFNLPSGGITGAVIEPLRATGLDEATLQNIAKFFEEYDLYRFTGAKISKADAGRLLELVNATITVLKTQKVTPVNQGKVLEG